MKSMLSLLTLAGVALGLLLGVLSRRRSPMPPALRFFALSLACVSIVILAWALIETQDFRPVFPMNDDAP